MLPYPTPAGQVGGHEGVGKVVKLGAGAESSGLKVGDRVGIKWVASTCGNCRMCQNTVSSPAFEANHHSSQNPVEREPTGYASTRRSRATTTQEHSNSTQ